MLWLIALLFVLLLVFPLIFFFYRLHLVTQLNAPKIVFAHVIFLIGFFLLIWSIKTFDMFREMQGWPSVSGEIYETKIAGTKALHPEIDYRFKVDGKVYSGSSSLETPAFGARNSLRETAQTILKDYKKGDKIEIHYNPKNPAESRVIVHAPWNSFMQYGVSVLFLAFAIAFMASGILHKRKQTRTQVN